MPVTRSEAETTPAPYEPKRPLLAATGLFALWIAILSLPMLAGKWLAGPWSDQYSTGYAFRAWGAEQLHRTGHVPLWNPELFGGLPFVGAMHGDIFYPTSWLRLVLPTATVMNLGFVLHYLAAALLTYALLRRLSLPWAAAVVGGLAYQLSGLIASYPSPGHDGKLFVSALLPLALLALVLALREKRWEGYGLLALAVGLALLSPHFQMTYYLLIASGLFALYLTFGERTAEPLGRRLGALGLALGAVLIGFGVAMIQILPFYRYLPFSPRAEGYYGFEGSTSYAIPWAHVPEFFLKLFTGSGDTYWGPNPLKLHSEYLGLPVVALAVLGAGDAKRRRLILWLGGIGLLFLLISLGAATPFYRVWWALMPYVKQTRAPGMAFFVVAFVCAVLAAMGTERLERREGARHGTAWLVAATVVTLLAVSGALGSAAASFAASHEEAVGHALAPAAEAARGGILAGALTSALALALLGVLAWAWRRGRLAAPAFASLLALIVASDLWFNARSFWRYSDAHRSLFQADALTARVRATPLPFRLLDLGVYPTFGSALMAFDVPEALGHHGNELNAYDQLLGGKNEWRYLGAPALWDLLAVRYIVAPQGRAIGGTDFAARFRPVMENVATSAGVAATLYERTDPAPYARVVPSAAKLPEERMVPTLLDPRLDASRVVLLAPDAPIELPRLDSMPAPGASRATVTAWAPGAMTLHLDPSPERDSYLLVSENWYPDWHASVDGHAVRTLRGDQTFLTVPVPRGARQVELRFASASYRTGKGITLASLAAVVLALLLPAVLKRRRG
jgi:hypothetical protein